MHKLQPLCVCCDKKNRYQHYIKDCKLQNTKPLQVKNKQEWQVLDFHQI